MTEPALSASGSPPRGATAQSAPSALLPPQEQSSALPNTSSLPTQDGAPLARSGRAIRSCSACGKPLSYQARSKLKTGLCRRCYDQQHHPRAGQATGNRCACGQKKQAMSKTCLACYRRTLPARNINQRDAMTLARETARRTRSKLELRAEELLVALGLRFERPFPIGRFVADFYLPDHDCVVEVYGGMHRRDPSCLVRDAERERVVLAAGHKFVVLSDLNEHLWWRLLKDAL